VGEGSLLRAKLALKMAYAAGCHALRIAPASRPRPHVSGVVLNYHYFTASTPRTYLEIPLSTLDSQLATIRKRFRVVSVPEMLRRGPDGGHAVCVTIDDTCLSVFEALPIFEAHAVPVTLFAPMGLCLGEGVHEGLQSSVLRHWLDLHDRRAPFDVPAAVFFENVLHMSRVQLESTLEQLQLARRCPKVVSSRKLMNEAQLRTVAGHPLVTLGAHSMTHARMATLPPAWLEWEVARSLELVQRVGGTGEIFAYPYGSPGAFSAATDACLVAHGVRAAFSTVSLPIPSPASRPFLLGRTTALDCASPAFVLGSAGGAFEWWDRLRFAGRLDAMKHPSPLASISQRRAFKAVSEIASSLTEASRAKSRRERVPEVEASK